MKKIKRELKFRAWEQELEIMIPYERIAGVMREPINGKLDHDSILHYSPLSPIGKGGYTIETLGSEFYEIMQSTGLKDKNDKEYYHMDVFSIGEDKYVVVENFGGWGFYDRMMKWTWLYTITSHAEIIGNIFENPELIK